jgi:hypothetical protein
MSSNVKQRHTLRTSRLALAMCAALACVALAACGSSKGSSSTAATQSASTSGSTSSTGAGGLAGSDRRFSALRECLTKNGVTLPRPPGGRGGPGAFFLGGGPKGGAFTPARRAQLQAAMKKCGAPGGLRFGQRLRRFGSNPLRNSPAFKQALTRYAACLRSNGMNVPTPNFSGKGPVFDTAHINTASARFRSAQIKCRGVLRTSGL